MKDLETIIREVVDAKAEQNNQIDLHAYENGMRDFAKAINYTRCCTQLKVANTDKINKLNNALKKIEDDDDFWQDNREEWIKQKSFIEGKINALVNL